MSIAPDSTERDLWMTRWALAQKDPWYFIRYFVNTMDEHDNTADARSKPFPAKAMYRIVCRAWTEYDLLFIEKSRQIMMTWIMSSLNLWYAMFHPAKRIFFQSKKQEDADAVLERARHVYKQLAELKLPNLPKARMVGEKYGTSDKLEFPGNDSKIWAIPQGPDIVASYTCSSIFADEDELQPMFSEGFSVALPTVTDGGKYTAQGTARGLGFVYCVLYGLDEKSRKPLGDHEIDSREIETDLLKPPPHFSDEEARYWTEEQLIEMPDEQFNAIPFAELIANVPGMHYWRTAQGTDVLQIHYTADPDKDRVTEAGRKWYPMARRLFKTQDKWDREMEMRRDTFAGRPVIDNWDRDIFVPRKPIKYDPGYPLFLAIDFGAQVCGCIFGQYVPLQDYNAHQFRILSEVIQQNSDTYRLGDAIVAKLTTQFSSAWGSGNFRTHCDPAGNQRSASTSDRSRQTDIQILRSKGLRPQSKKFGIVESTEFVKAIFNTQYASGDPAIIIDGSCDYIIRVCGGGWHYPESDGGIHDDKPEKDGIFDHGGDMIRILLNNVINPRDFNSPDEKSSYTKLIRDRQGRVVGAKRVQNNSRELFRVR